MGKILIGIVMLVIGGLTLPYVYSLRPPEDFGDIFRIVMANNQNNFLEEPIYRVLMTISGIISFIGLLLVIVGITNNK